MHAHVSISRAEVLGHLEAHYRNQLKPSTSPNAMEYGEAGSSHDGMWEQIPFRELTVCEVLAGGGVALVHRGIYRKNSVALKTLVRTEMTAVLFSIATGWSLMTVAV